MLGSGNVLKESIIVKSGMCVCACACVRACTYTSTCVRACVRVRARVYIRFQVSYLVQKLSGARQKQSRKFTFIRVCDGIFHHKCR